MNHLNSICLEIWNLTTKPNHSKKNLSNPKLLQLIWFEMHTNGNENDYSAVKMQF